MAAVVTNTDVTPVDLAEAVTSVVTSCAQR
jgi:hypothetical protein